MDWDTFQSLIPDVGAQAAAIPTMHNPSTWAMTPRRQVFGALGAPSAPKQPAYVGAPNGFLDNLALALNGMQAPGAYGHGVEGANFLYGLGHALAAPRVAQMEHGQLEAQRQQQLQDMQALFTQQQQLADTRERAAHPSRSLTPQEAALTLPTGQTLSSLYGDQPQPESQIQELVREATGHGPIETPEQRLHFAVQQHNMEKDADEARVDQMLSPEALDQAAERYMLTGDFGAWGLGSARTRMRIATRGAELFPQAHIAVNRAQYMADQGSLRNTQRITDQVTSFAKTAMDNMKPLLQAASKIPDLNSPWMNEPLRTVSEKGLGNTHLNAFNTARKIDVSEFSRVINTAAANGIVTDEARDKIDKLLGPDVTFKGLLSALDVLKTDADNRIRNLNSTNKQIAQRIQDDVYGISGPPQADPSALLDKHGVK